ncbi:MAG: CBS domain-containing protein [Myxococcales bacterium]|mgnify:FL=1|nr:CBS domain-containing protein [Myxococcales bacterium]MBL0195759.1 CBS domain-containing protein [Myxococcales bacterium]HQY60047.1 CBS domain-containing protein [Polyangiaceae bacterium]
MHRHHRQVDELMITDVLSVREGEPIAKAMHVMATARVHHLPVVDGRYHLVGLVSDRDLLNALAGDKNRTDPVGAVMQTPVKSVRATTHAHTAARTMLDSGIHSLPVVAEDGALVGMITASDFLAVAEEALRGIEVAKERLE